MSRTPVILIALAFALLTWLTFPVGASADDPAKQGAKISATTPPVSQPATQPASPLLQSAVPGAAVSSPATPSVAPTTPLTPQAPGSPTQSMTTLPAAPP